MHRLPFQEVILAMSDREVSAAVRTCLLTMDTPLQILAECSDPGEFTKINQASAVPPVRLVFIDSTILQAIPNYINHMEYLGARLYCILISEAPDFSALQFALRCGVIDCLLYPFSKKALAESLRRIADRHAHRDAQVPTEQNEASRYLFWRNDLRRLSSSHIPMADVNREYGTHFASGVFRALFVEMSSTMGQAEQIVDNKKMMEQIIRVSGQILRADCHDMLYNRHANGVSFLLNYGAGKRGHVARLIDQLFFKLRDDFSNHGIEITMAIGREYSEFIKLPEIKQEILDARWARRQMGSGRMISAESLAEKTLRPEQRYEMRNLHAVILHSFELLDTDRAAQYLNNFYDRFAAMLPVREMRTFTRSLLDFLFQRYQEELAVYGSPENLRHSYIAAESTASTTEKFREVTVNNLMDVIDKVRFVVRRQYSSPVRDCIAYISLHHCDAIRLCDMAEMVHLSPQYLSALFHKETGQTISAYVQEQRLRLARSMLESSTKNIAEIAEYLGFQDPHYFSKFFRAKMQMTPTAYRSLKQLGGAARY